MQQASPDESGRSPVLNAPIRGVQGDEGGEGWVVQYPVVDFRRMLKSAGPDACGPRVVEDGDDDGCVT